MEKTYHHSQFLANLGRDKPQYEPSDGQPEPEARGRDAALEGAAVADLDHELDDPAAERDLDAHVA